MSTYNPFENMEQKVEAAFEGLNVLSSSYVPEYFPHREQQIESMVKALGVILKNNRASNLILYGKSGTGKTSVTKYITNMLREATSNKVRVIYINCQVYDSPYSIMVTIVNSITDDVNSQIPSLGWPLDKIYQEFLNRMNGSNKYVLVVLDEIDKLVEKNGGDSLYVILKAVDEELIGSRISIIGITNYTSFAEKLDARVRSRLNQESIIFQPYDATQLRDILAERLKSLNGKGVIEDSAINLCAAIAAREHGDARKAIDLMRISIEMAIREHSDKVTEREVYRARNKFELDVLHESVRSLPLHTKIVLLSVILTQRVANRPIYTGEVYENYRRICEELSMQALTSRRVSDLLADLDDIGLIVSLNKSLGRAGRSRFLRVPDHLDLIEEYVLEDEQLSTFKGVKLSKQQRLRGITEDDERDLRDLLNARIDRHQG